MFGFAPSLRLGPGLAGEVSAEVTEQALVALREALSNAARHSGASEVDVTVDMAVHPTGHTTGHPTGDGVLTVLVVDNGTGIPAGVARSGLRNLAARAEKLGGELRLGPRDPGSRCWDRPHREPAWSGGSGVPFRRERAQNLALTIVTVRQPDHQSRAAACLPA